MSTQNRQPKGIPTGGEFAKNEHAEADGSLSGASSYQGIPIDTDYAQSPLGALDVPTVAEDEGLAMRDGENAWHCASDEEMGRYLRYWEDVNDTDVTADSDSRAAFTIGHPTDESIDSQVDWASENDVVLIIDTGNGKIEVSRGDVQEGLIDRSLLEEYTVVGSYRANNGQEGNPYGASEKAIYVASEAGRLLAAGKNKEASDLILAFHAEPGGKDDHYAALATHQPLTDERRERLDALMSEHGVTRAEVEKEIANEFGMYIPFDAPNGAKAYTQEHPNRIMNRISDDYLEEVVATAARDR